MKEEEGAQSKKKNQDPANTHGGGAAMALTPACEAAYLRVFEDKSPTDWCTLGYEGRKLVPTGEGEGGLAELREQFDDGSIAYALLRRKITDDGGDSHRTKFIMLVWCAPSRATPPPRRPRRPRRRRRPEPERHQAGNIQAPPPGGHRAGEQGTGPGRRRCRCPHHPAVRH